jgi:hypothetical protein
MNPSKRIDEMIAALPDWRGRVIADIRKTIHAADPEVEEAWKWMGTPVWCHNGNVCLANAHKQWVNLVFSHGASLQDPHKLFNSFLDGKVWRAVKFVEGDKVDGPALKALVQAAVLLNMAKPAKGGKAKVKKTAEDSKKRA